MKRSVLLTMLFAILAAPALSGTLHDAILHGSKQDVVDALEAGADVNADDLLAGLPLMVAARLGDVEKVSLLIEHGADINVIDVSGTALHAAVGSGSVEIIELLVAAGADIELTPDGRTTPLNYAAQLGDTLVMKTLLSHGAKLEPTGARPSALHFAAGAGKIEAVQLLLRRGASIAHGDHDGHSPVLRAVANGHADIIEVLLEAGADVNEKHLGGSSLLETARRGAHTAAVEVLLRYGAVE